MKNRSARLFVALMLIILMSGCMTNQIETPAPVATLSATPAPIESAMPPETIAPVYTPEPESVIPPEASYPADGEATEQREWFKNMKTENGEWVYYADWNQMFYIKDDYECPIKRVKKDGSEDMDLGITGFMFTIVDKYIYVDKNHTFGDFGHWDTVRIDLDGANKKDMPYPNMSIKIYGDRIYFNTWNGSVLYAADSACEQVKEYNIDVPDQQTIDDNLKSISPVHLLSIKDVKDGWIYFHYNLLDTDGLPFYEGAYRINLDGTIVEKTNEGTFNETQIGYYN